MQYTLGVDIGGTFTDFSLIDAEGKITLWKEASTPQDSKRAIITGLNAMSENEGLPLSDFLGRLDLFVHGQTIATNTVIQRNGPKTAVLCTEGFRDVIHFRDGFKPQRYNIQLQPPKDFVPRYLRIPITERVNYKGEILKALDEESVMEAIKALKKENVDFFYLKKKEVIPTGTCLILITPDSERTMITFLGTAGKISENDIDSDAVKRSEHQGENNIYLEEIEELNEKHVNILSDNNIVTSADFEDLDKDHILSIKGLGPKTYEKIISLIQVYKEKATEDVKENVNEDTVTQEEEA